MSIAKTSVIFILVLMSVAAVAALPASLLDIDLLKQQKKDIRWARSAVRKLKTSNAGQFLQAVNKKLIQELMTAPATKSIGTSNELEAASIHRMMPDHSVIGDTASRKYDDSSQSIGFCFGRAAFVHWELLRRGVKPENIRKLFVVGGLFRNGFRWDYHVATAVRNSAGGWLVIDSSQTEVLPVDEWFKEIFKFAIGEDFMFTRLYFTTAEKFLPLPGAYSDDVLQNSIYKGYFQDLKVWFANPNTNPNQASKSNIVKAVDRPVGLN